MQNFLTIGTYDGVHLGHRKIIRTAMREALKRGMKSRVVYFPVPPKFFFSGEKTNCLITLPAEREKLLSDLRPDGVEALPFDRKLASMHAGDFFQDLVVGRFGAGGLCVGPDFAVGKGREGHLDFLREACMASGMYFKSVNFARRLGHKISSSLIRAHLRAGAVEEANICLGWAYSASGPVIKGAGIGRQIGFPTANVGVHPAKILPPGIFASRVKVDGESFNAVLNVGKRPTVESLGSKVVLEAHLLDFSRMIYGKTLEVTFLRHIRPERKFSSRESLIEHIKSDIAAARKFFK
ncbi:MAG TPA: riboflavin biosynthesis protein RibF [Elusimicrobia bacterium]|nr:MAG: riboflavin biosynthesis protein RibF [Elusimicrobia bacterium GWF2_62_30]HBA60659.1 riboflavin biosynthesis protein RibF [Elusimicrobiota bacterium]